MDGEQSRLPVTSRVLEGVLRREGPEVPSGGRWSRKFALPEREAWGQPGAGGDLGFPPGRPGKGLGGGEGR